MRFAWHEYPLQLLPGRLLQRASMICAIITLHMYYLIGDWFKLAGVVVVMQYDDEIIHRFS